MENSRYKENNSPNIGPRLLLVEIDGKFLVLHRLSCSQDDERKLDDFAVGTLVPQLANLVTRGGGVTSVAYLTPNPAVPGRFRILEAQPHLEIDYVIEAYDIVRRFET